MSALAHQERESLAQRERESDNEGTRTEPRIRRRQKQMQTQNSEVDCHRMGTKTVGEGIRTVRSMPESAESSRLRTLVKRWFDGRGHNNKKKLLSSSMDCCRRRRWIVVVVVVVVNEVVRALDEEVVVSCHVLSSGPSHVRRRPPRQQRWRGQRYVSQNIDYYAPFNARPLVITLSAEYSNY